MDTADFKRIYEDATGALDSEGEDLLAAVIKQQDAQAAAIKRVSELDAEDIDRLLRDLTVGDADTRWIAYSLLTVADDRVVDQVAEAYTTCSHARARETLVDALVTWAEENDRAFATLARALSDRSKHVRARACSRLGYVPRPEAEPLLKTATRDKDPFVREAARDALRQLRLTLKEVAAEAGLPERLRSFPRLTAKLRKQLLAVPASHDPGASGIDYRPCLVTLRDGSARDHVYVQEVERYHVLWGVLPENDEGKRSVSLSEVTAISESPSRLPIPIANTIYATGESGMGYYVFTLVFDDGREVPSLTGDAVDFVVLPDGLDPKRVVDVRTGTPYGLAESAYAPSADYAWCLYGKEPEA